MSQPFYRNYRTKDFSTAVEVPGYRKTFPFLEEHNIKGAAIVEIDFFGDQTIFEADETLGQTLSLTGDLSNDKSLAGLDLLHMQTTQPVPTQHADLLKWTKKYANIPPAFESYAATQYNFVGFNSQPVAIWEPDRINGSQGSTKMTFTNTGGAAHGYSSGQLIQIFVTWRKWLPNPTSDTKEIAYTVKILSVNSPTSIIVEMDYVIEHGKTIFPNSTARILKVKAQPSIGTTRQPYTAQTTGYTIHDFFLAETPGDIALIQDFKATDAGTVTNNLTDSTNPSVSTYLDWINTGAQIVSASSTIERYLGDIFERKTTYVKAQ